MPHGPRRFAKNSENTRHFRLVARSQRDAEGANEEASPLVLEPYVPTSLMHKKGVDEAELMTIPESLQRLGPEVFGLETRDDKTERDYDKEIKDGDSEEEDEDGFTALDDDCYFPKDGYNYNQHLKTLSKNKKTGGVGGIVIDAPASYNKEVIGYIDPVEGFQVQQPQTTEEEEVMQAIEDNDKYEEFDDEFLDGLVPGGAVNPETALWGQTAADDVGLPDLAIFKEMHAQRMAAMAGEDGDEDDEDDYGSEGPEEPGQVVSAARFDQLLADEYSDGEDGALDDDEEIGGTVTMDKVEAMLDEYLDDQLAEKQKLESLCEPQEGKLDDCPRTTTETKAIVERFYLNEDEADAETSEGESEEDESKNWDCESVLSTLSNLSNRPGKISKIKLIKKPRDDKDLPAIVEGGSDAESEEDAVELPDVVTVRPKDESAEDKKIRKNAVKEMRKICRKMKKESKEMYKEEAAKLNKKQGSADVRAGLRCLRL